MEWNKRLRLRSPACRSGGQVVTVTGFVERPALARQKLDNASKRKTRSGPGLLKKTQPTRLPAPRSPGKCNAGTHGNGGQVDARRNESRNRNRPPLHHSNCERSELT